ncbi:alginate lyase family protein [Bacteroidota bacterium]
MRIILIIFLFIQSVFCINCESDTKPKEGKLLYIPENLLHELKKDIIDNDDSLEPYVTQLRELADNMMNEGPWSILDDQINIPDKDVQDYYSESPYWWPDPENPEEPYIRHDGVRNPDRFIGHKTLLMKTYQAVTALSFASYLFDKKEYAEKAAEIIEVWFINEKSKMNPHLKYAQIIRNKPVKRGVGIIETHRFTRFIEAVNVLHKTGYWSDDEYRSLQKWFEEFLVWLTVSEYGIDEKERGNNHSSWWAAQVAAFSTFVDKLELLNEINDYAETFLVDNQFKSDGSQPKEEERTLSLFYSTFNLSALTTLACVLGNYDYDLWNYKNRENSSLIDGIEYTTLYVTNPDDWEKTQLKPLEEDAPLYLGFAGLALDNYDYIKLYKELNNKLQFDTYDTFGDPFELILDMLIEYKFNKHTTE